MPAHNSSLTRRTWETPSLNLAGAGYPDNEVQAFVKAYQKCRGQHPDKYAAGWRALDRQRAATNGAEAKNSAPKSNV